MFARKHKVQMCRARPSAASLSGLCSVAMRETLYAEVDLTDAIVNLVKQGHYSGVSVAIFRADASEQSETKPSLSAEPA